MKLVVPKQFIYSGNEICEERDASGAVTKQFFPLGVRVGSNNFFYGKDHLGSVRTVTDQSGTIVAQYDFDPFGRATKLSGSFDADFQYAGYYMHAPSGLNLTMFRAYNPTQGRWLSRDPLEEAGGVNPYDYVGGNPISFADPLGLVRRYEMYSNYKLYMQALQAPSLEALKEMIEANEGVITKQEIEIAQSLVNILEKSRARGIDLKPIADQIPGSIKRAPSYCEQLGQLSLQQLEKLSRQSNNTTSELLRGLGNRAGEILKLYKEQDRLMNK